MKSLIKIRNDIVGFFGHLKFNWSIGFIGGIQYKPVGYKVKGNDTEVIINTIQPGDVLLRGYDLFLSSKLIGYWSHSGLVLDNNTVIHAIGKGVIKESIIDFCRTDRVFILRPNLKEKEINKALVIGKSLIGKSYDFKFDFDDPSEYSCTEFVYACYENNKDKLGMFKKEFNILGMFKKNVIEPKMFLDYNGFEKILVKE